MIIRKKFLIIIALIIIISISYIEVNAAVNTGNGDDAGTGETAPVVLDNPLGDNASTDVNVLIGRIINGVLGVVGSLALVMFIYGGFVWMTARGNRDAITKGKDILVWAIIGMVVIFTSYAAVSFVLKNVVQSEATENQGQNP
jgi:hypothetical protein